MLRLQIIQKAYGRLETVDTGGELRLRDGSKSPCCAVKAGLNLATFSRYGTQEKRTNERGTNKAFQIETEFLTHLDSRVKR